jgi:hypothetical protein
MSSRYDAYVTATPMSRYDGKNQTPWTSSRSTNDGACPALKPVCLMIPIARSVPAIVCSNHGPTLPVATTHTR